jgi:hypothetical protein
MNRTKRYIAAEMTSLSSLLLVTSGHYLWRASHMFKAGLTPKEFELIEKKREELTEIQMLLSKVAHRLRQSGKCT